ncbi:MAG: ABC-F family ATP-binding cassette domain-containing protein [Clostridia bacterium]|nr:ABC-F family ATP-binding cassette domain-containing protein [Clostridia bacterium]MBQ1934830.1 ABC-F family ATP-binding cassette domain-containing protein [Clostridia bacterium]MBQ5649220.1 ABC-F family ATP-binding cassette domain-containing protein [Clostridia bacterium]MBQ5809206.1 ABC-F family ATP-binding cassette domain-containing protein [Clostridia bacterium]
MTILSVSNVSLAFGTDVILEDISFSVNEGDRVGVVGRNGAGKTSLFRILLGEEDPTTGSFAYARGKTVACLEQNSCADADPDLTVTEYMYRGVPEIIALEAEIAATERRLESEGGASLASRLNDLNEKFTALGGRHYKSRCDSLLTKTGFTAVDAQNPLSALSGGQRTRLALARILFAEPDVLMLDEPTNHLDADTLFWLEGFLAQYKKTLIVISHDRYFLDRVTNKTLVVENLHAKLYPGNYSKTEELRDAERAFEEKRWKLQQKEIARIKAHIEQQRRFGRERNFVTIASREKALARMEKYARPVAEQRSMRLEFKAGNTSGNDVLTIRKLAMGFEGKPLFSEVDLDIKRGERLFVVGANGVGKSTLMRIICGKLSANSGSIIHGVGVKIAYYDQENHGINGANTVFDELADAYPQKKEGEIRSLLGAFLFCGEDVFKSVANLSGGERCRLALAKLMWSGANLLILDEPTNHLDINSKEALEAALEEFEGTIISVSHDRYFIDKLATRIVELLPAERGGILSYPMTADDDYNSFREFRSADAAKHVGSAPTAVASTEQEGKNDYLRRKEEAAAKRKAEKRKQQRDARIAELEKLLPEMEKEMYDPATDYVRAAELSKLIEASEEELLLLYEEAEEE